MAEPISTGAFLLGSLGSAALGVGGNYIANRGSSGSQKRAYNYQRQLNEQTNEMSRQNYFDFFDYEAQYNSPYNQMARLMQTGINPYAAANELGAGVSETSVGAPSAPSGSAPSMYQPRSLFEGIPNQMAQLAESLYTLSKTKGQNLDNEYQRETLAKRVESLGLQVENQEVSNSIQKLDLAAAEVSKVRGAQQLIEKNDKELLRMTIENENLDLEQFMKQLEIDSKEIENRLHGKELEQYIKSMPLYIQQLKETITLLQKQQQTQSTEQTKNLAIAREANSSANLNLSRAESQRIINKYLPQIQQYDIVLKRFEAEGLSIKNRYEAQRMIIDARKALPEIKKLFAEGSEVFKKIEYLQGQIDKIPHEIDKIDSETFKNTAKGLRDVINTSLDLTSALGITK